MNGHDHDQHTRWAAVSRVGAALVGSLALALAASACLALWLGDPQRLGLALGVALFFPIWVAAMCPGLLARSAWKPWLGYLGTALALAGAAWVRLRGGRP
jgi:hypothetical protein